MSRPSYSCAKCGHHIHPTAGTIFHKSSTSLHLWFGIRAQAHPALIEIYVAGDTHTNTIEGFWSLVKRGISGVYHSVSAKYLQSYLDENSYRYNHRNDTRAMFEGPA